MFKTFATNVVVSKGYEGAAALRYSENGESVRFRIGQKVYDSREEGNYRWLNISVKAFGAVCERIRKMKLKEGSFVNLAARLDEEKWTDQETQKERSQHVLIVEDIEYAYVGKSGENQNASQNQSQGQNPQGSQYQQAAPAGVAPAGVAPAGAAPAGQGQAPAAGQAAAQPADPMEADGFMGFEAFGGNNLFSV